MIGESRDGGRTRVPCNLAPRAWVLIFLSLAAAAASAQELVFTALPPCRAVDTRFGSGGILAPGVVRSLILRNRCGVPGLTNDGGAEMNQALALAVNLVAVSPSGPGHLIAWPTNQSPPATSIINYSASSETGGLSIANGVILPMCNSVSTTPCATGDISFVAAVSAVHLIVDVVGYFATPRHISTHRYGAGAGFDSFLCLNNAAGVRFGLSHMLANYAGADTVCPAGTWVCSGAERGDIGCDTSRPDTLLEDMVSCSGQSINLPENDHKGWTNSSRSGNTAFVVDEDGILSFQDQCVQLPSWCCSRD